MSINYQNDSWKQDYIDGAIKVLSFGVVGLIGLAIGLLTHGQSKDWPEPPKELTAVSAGDIEIPVAEGQEDQEDDSMKVIVLEFDNGTRWYRKKDLVHMLDSLGEYMEETPKLKLKKMDLESEIVKLKRRVSELQRELEYKQMESDRRGQERDYYQSRVDKFRASKAWDAFAMYEGFELALVDLLEACEESTRIPHNLGRYAVTNGANHTEFSREVGIGLANLFRTR